MQIVQQLIYHTVNEFHYIIHRLKSLRIFIRDFYIKLIFNSHDDFDSLN